MQHRHEESDANGVKRGSYGYVDANGVYRKVFYVADKNGFRIKEMKSNEPGFDAKVATEAIKETSKLKPLESPPLSTTPYHSSGQLSPSLLPTASNYHTSPGATSLIGDGKLSLTDRDLNNQLVKASFNLNTSESKKDSSKTTKSRSVISTPTNYESINGKVNGNLVSHSLLPDSIRPNTKYAPYAKPGNGLIGNPNFIKDIGPSSDNRREFAEEPYVYYAHPPAGESVNHGLNSNSVASTLPLRPIDTVFPYPFVSPKTTNGYQSSDNVLNGNSLQSSHSIPIYSQLNAGKSMSPYLQPMPIHTYRAPSTNGSAYGVNYASNSPKTVYVPVYPPIIPNTIYSNEQPGYTVTPATPLYAPPFESTRLRPPEPTSPTTLGYLHPLQPIRSATTPAYGPSPSKYHNFNSPPLDNSIERTPTRDHKHPMDHGYSNGYPGPSYSPYMNPPYSPGGPTQSSPPYNPYLMKPLSNGGGNSIDPPPHSSSSLDRPLQYLDGPGPGSMIGSNRMQPTVFYVSDSANPDSLIKKQNSIDPEGLPYGHAPHRTGPPHDPTPHGFESPFIDMPPTPPPVPPPEGDNNQGHASSSGPPGSPPDSPPDHHPGHHNPYRGAPPSPPGHPLDAHHHASNPYYNPNYNPYGPAPTAANSAPIASDPARAQLASYYRAILQAAPPSSSPISPSPSAATSTSSSSPSTSNEPSVLLGIRSAHGLEVATSLGSLNDADANYNPSHYPTPDQLSKWKAKVRSNFRRNRSRNRANSLSTDDDSDDDAVVSSSSDIELKRIHSLDSNNKRSILNQRLNLNYSRNSLLVQLSGQSNSTTPAPITTPQLSLSRGIRWPGGLR